MLNQPQSQLAERERLSGVDIVDRCVALLAAVRYGQPVAWPSFFQLQQVRETRIAGLPKHLIAPKDVIILAKPRERCGSGGRR